MRRVMFPTRSEIVTSANGASTGSAQPVDTHLPSAPNSSVACAGAEFRPSK